MRVKILGSAAGGGFPQWNCACLNCARVRAGTFHGHVRTQAQIAIREGDRPWCLINASPDLRSQILADPDFAPQAAPRSSPIAAVVLTGAEIDQVMGLLHLREFHSFQVYATPTVEALLHEENSIFSALHQVHPQAEFKLMTPGKTAEAQAPGGADLGFKIRAMPIDSSAPTYSKLHVSQDAKQNDALIAIYIEAADGKKFLCAPSLPYIHDSWFADWNDCDAIFVDGTFWSDDELPRTRGGGKFARGMGHLPISGAGGTLERLAKLTRPRKIYFHINNTNPILDEDSAEHRAVREAGWEIAYDGMVLEL
jgi:pyrroloquinoline quinone biosynthesis protein B